MWRALLSLPILLALAAPVHGHLSFNIAVDAEGNAYLLEVFTNRLLKVTAEGEVSELVDFWEIAPGVRQHALGIDAAGSLYAGGHREERIWRVAPTGAVSTAYPFGEHERFGKEILHVGLHGAGAITFMDWTYGAAPGEGQRFRIFRVAEPGATPVPLFACEEGDDDFLDFHVGSMIVTGDGTPVFSNAHRIWKLDPDGELVPVAGSGEKGHADGPAQQARFSHPHGMAMDPDGNLLVAELSGRLRRIDPAGVVTTLAGGSERGYVDGPLSESRFEQVFGVGLGPDGRIVVAEYAPKQEYRVRLLVDGEVRTLARIPSDGTFRK